NKTEQLQQSGICFRDPSPWLPRLVMGKLFNSFTPVACVMWAQLGLNNLKPNVKGAFIGLIFSWEGFYGRIIAEKNAC
ncbi:unnamed protein product, partial [marine sediment metagenome]